MKNLLLLLAATSLLATGCLKGKSATGGVDPKTDDEKAIYALGQMNARQVRIHDFDLKGRDLQVWVQGIQDSISGKTDKVDLQAFSKELPKLRDARLKRMAEDEKKASQAYLTKMKAEKGAETLASGVIFTETAAGTGDMPKADSMVKVHYHGTLRDGTVFDSSVDRKAPATFPLNRVIPCWTEAVQKIKVGGKAKVVCPSDTAYGDQGQPPKIKPGTTLTFAVELLEIVPKPTPAAPKK